MLDKDLADKSTHQFEEFKSPLENLLSDERLQFLRLHYERKVVERFIENYMKALRDFKIVSSTADYVTGRPSFIVKALNSDPRYNVRNWSCCCNELETTGVACPHLILCASTVEEKEYS